MSEPMSRDTRSTVLLAALPPLLFGLAVSLLVLSYAPLSQLVWNGATPLPAFQRQPTWPVLGLALLLGLALAAGALWGLLRRLPRWSHTWTTTALVGVSFLLMILGDDREYVVSPAADVAIALGLFLLLVALAAVAARRSWSEAALLGMGFCAAFALAVNFTSTAGPMLRVDVALWSAPAGLAFALLFVAFQRGSRPVPWLALLGTAVLALSLIGQYTLLVRAALGPPYDLNFLRVLLAITLLGLVSPPALSWLLGWRTQPQAS